MGANLLHEVVLGSLDLALGLLALGLQEGAELSGIPAAVGSHDVVVPVLLNEALKILAVGRGRVRDGVIREPALKLRLVPFVVDFTLVSFKVWTMANVPPTVSSSDKPSYSEGFWKLESLPDLVPGNQLLAAAPATAKEPANTALSLIVT